MEAKIRNCWSKSLGKAAHVGTCRTELTASYIRSHGCHTLHTRVPLTPCTHTIPHTHLTPLHATPQDNPFEPKDTGSKLPESLPANPEIPEILLPVDEVEEEDEVDLETVREQQEEYLERLGQFYDQRAPFRFDSPEEAPNAREQLLEHASVEISTEEEYSLFTVSQEDNDDADDQEVLFNVNPIRWLFSLTSSLPDSDGLTYNQRQLEIRGHDAQQYKLGGRLAMWVGCREFLSTSEMVHIKGQFPFLTWVPEEQRWLQELDPSVNAESLLDDIYNLDQNVKFTPFYPLYLLGATEGSDMLPCIFQLPATASLTSGSIFSLLGISPAVARLFPRPLAFKNSADFIKYLKPRVDKGAAQFQEWLDEAVESGVLDNEAVEEINELEHFEEWMECLKFLAEYARPPYLLVVAGNADIGFDRIPVFFLGTSPHDSSRVIGAVMGLGWDDETSISLK